MAHNLTEDNEKQPKILPAVGEPNEGILVHLLAQIIMNTCIDEVPADQRPEGPEPDPETKRRPK